MKKPFFHIMIIEDDESYSAAQIRDLLKKAEEQGHPLGVGTYLENMTLRQLDALVAGRTAA